MNRKLIYIISLASVLMFSSSIALASKTTSSHGLSFHGTPAYPADFTHFNYANPDAPKGGKLKKAALGTFDTFNTFAPKGNWADGSYLLYDPLMVKAGDEPYSVYGLIAEHIEYPEDFSWIKYHINPEARFHDGKPITADDVVFTFQSLQKKGPPHYRHLYSDITEVKATSRLTVQFSFSTPPSKNLVLRLSRLRVLPAHYWGKEENDLGRASLKPPVASGPYKIKSFEAGHYVLYERVKDYWAADLPVNKGRHNFDQIRTEYFRDDTVALEAFKQGSFDLRVDANPRNWSLGYQGSELRAGQIIQEKLPNKTLGTRAYVFNLRKPLFQDRNLRQAIALALDFNWLNHHLFFDMYYPSYSLFSNSELAATELPDSAELALLAPWRDQLSEEVFSKVWQPTRTDGSGNWRHNKIQALKKLKASGWVFKDGVLSKNGQPLTFEITLSQAEFERFVIPFAHNLEELGITARVNTIDTSQYINRMRKFDFDMVIHGFYPSITPGTELKNFWGSASANAEAGQNISGIQLPVLDNLIEKAINANSREELIHLTRAIDRIVLWEYAVIPQWYLPYWPMVYRRGLRHPQTLPPYEMGLSTWWWESPPE